MRRIKRKARALCCLDPQTESPESTPSPNSSTYKQLAPGRADLNTIKARLIDDKSLSSQGNALGKGRLPPIKPNQFLVSKEDTNSDASSWSMSDYSSDISSEFEVPVHPFTVQNTDSNISGLRRVRGFQRLDVPMMDDQPSELACSTKQLSITPFASSGHRVVTPKPGTSSSLSRAASFQSSGIRSPTSQKGMKSASIDDIKPSHKPVRKEAWTRNTSARKGHPLYTTLNSSDEKMMDDIMRDVEVQERDLPSSTILTKDVNGQSNILKPTASEFASQKSVSKLPSNSSSASDEFYLCSVSSTKGTKWDSSYRGQNSNCANSTGFTSSTPGLAPTPPKPRSAWGTTSASNYKVNATKQSRPTDAYISEVKQTPLDKKPSKNVFGCTQSEEDLMDRIEREDADGLLSIPSQQSNTHLADLSLSLKGVAIKPSYEKENKPQPATRRYIGNGNSMRLSPNSISQSKGNTNSPRRIPEKQQEMEIVEYSDSDSDDSIFNLKETQAARNAILCPRPPAMQRPKAALQRNRLPLEQQRRKSKIIYPEFKEIPNLHGKSAWDLSEVTGGRTFVPVPPPGHPPHHSRARNERPKGARRHVCVVDGVELDLDDDELDKKLGITTLPDNDPDLAEPTKSASLFPNLADKYLNNKTKRFPPPHRKMY